jgi:hypothetical protein
VVQIQFQQLHQLVVEVVLGLVDQQVEQEILVDGGGGSEATGGSGGAGNTPPVSPSQGNPGVQVVVNLGVLPLQVVGVEELEQLVVMLHQTEIQVVQVEMAHLQIQWFNCCKSWWRWW